VITVKFACDGCGAEAEGTDFLRRHFIPIKGKSYGLGKYQYDGPLDVAPDGWLAFVPRTGCCYCPDCCKEIEAGS